MNLKQTAPLFSASLLLILSTIPSAAEDGVLGRVGNVEVRLSDVDATLSSLDSRDREAVKADATRLNAIVRSLLVQRLVLKEAEEKKWEKEPAVAAQLARARESALVDSFIAAKTRPADDYPSEDELKAAYEANKSALLVPRTFLILQVFISSPKGGADAAQESAAAQKLARLRELLAVSGADFAAIAKEHSEDVASAGQGGQIGWLAEAQIQPEIREQLPKLKLNVVSEPLRLDDGWHIIKVQDVREAHTPLLNQVRDQLAQQLRAERERLNREAYISGLLKENPIAINEVALSEVNAKKSR